MVCNTDRDDEQERQHLAALRSYNIEGWSPCCRDTAGSTKADLPALHRTDCRIRCSMLIDTHCHLDFADFAEERDAIVARAHEIGVKQMVTISTKVRKLDGLLELTERYPSVFCSVGTHPMGWRSHVPG